jgi:hypothetical protein
MLALVAFLLLAGCAAPAPTLPPDTTSVNRTQSLALADFTTADQALSCDQIAAGLRSIDGEMQAANARIEANRVQNEVAGYFGVLYLVPLVATEGNYAEKDEISRLYQRRDTLVKLAVLKACAVGK